MLAERAFYCSSSFRALFFGCQPGGFFMEQKHTLEENGYYAQVTDQLIENIGYQMIRRNWSMKTLADKADLPYETVKHLMAGKIGRPSFISILKIANALECSLDDLAGRNNPALEGLRRLADHADGMYQIFAEVEIGKKIRFDKGRCFPDDPDVYAADPGRKRISTAVFCCGYDHRGPYPWF